MDKRKKEGEFKFRNKLRLGGILFKVLKLKKRQFNMKFSEQVQNAVIFSLVFVVANCLQFTFSRIEYVTSDVVDHFTGRSVLHCARVCAHQEICDGWKYFDERKECFLLYKMTSFRVISHSSDLVPNENIYMVSRNDIYS